MFQLSHAPRWLFALDKTTEDFLAARDAGGSDQREIRTCCGKCALTAPTHHPSSTDQTTGVHQDGSNPPGASGQSGSDLETSALARPARDASCAGIVSSFVCSGSTNRRRRSKKAKALARDDQLDQGDGSKQRLWGAERIRGELLKLDIRVSKRTIQKYMKQVRPKRARGQNWKTFLRNHAAEVWACDFLQVTDLFFRPLFAFFIIELKSRKVIHVNVTRSPTDPWVAQQLREATPYGQTPKYLIRDNDRKFGSHFARVATTSGIKVLRTPYRTPRANAVCERFLGSVRRECLDHFLILHEKQLHRLLKAYVMYFNQARPHQGIQQQRPEPPVSSLSLQNQMDKIISVAILGGLHQDYRRAA